MYARSESAIEPYPSLIKDTFCNSETYKVTQATGTILSLIYGAQFLILQFSVPPHLWECIPRFSIDT